MSEKQVTLITLGVLAVIVLVGGVAIYVLQFKVLRKKDQDITNMQKSLKEDQAKQRDIDKVRKDAAAQAKIEKEKEGRIPVLDIEEYDRFMDTVEAMRQKSGVMIGTAKMVTPKKATGGKAAVKLPANIHKVTYDFVVIGGFAQLLRFLNLVEQQNRFMRVETFSIGAGKSGAVKALGLVPTMKVQLYTYTYKVEVKPGEKKEEKKPEEVSNPSTPLPD